MPLFEDLDFVWNLIVGDIYQVEYGSAWPQTTNMGI